MYGDRFKNYCCGYSELDNEKKVLNKGSFKGKKIAVLTSGGDSQGMNSAVRAVVRMGIYYGSSVYVISDGYEGLVTGKERIIKATWASVSGIIQLGGTVIGSDRCDKFRTREGRKISAKNLIDVGITNLVIIGGGGCLTGANLFKLEWEELIKELLDEGLISGWQHKSYYSLNIVGMVGSVDNDFCGTDIAIGTDSALHRIIEACDAISSTTHSQHRCFIIEVMGQSCGYLALVAALASEAEWVFIPEHPPEDGWEDKLCDKLTRNLAIGQRVNIIIVSEGAIDIQCKPITARMVNTIISSKVNIDSRVTVLGHLQRGGNPSAFDRILGIRMGAEAVLALIDAEENPGMEACVIALIGNQTVRVPLMKCVKKTKSVEESLKNCEFDNVVNFRGRTFKNYLSTFIKLSKSYPPKTMKRNNKRIAILTVGAPACGMNAVVRTFTRFMIIEGYDVIGVREGFGGLAYGTHEFLDWNKVKGWVGLGGSILGIRSDTPEQVGMDLISKKLVELDIYGMLIIGGFEAFHGALQMFKARDKFPSFNIPILCIPATISNNVPGTDLSIGSDTSLNEITQILDKLKQSADSTHRRVFLVETHGGYCGYLATMSGLAGGADSAYIFEEPFKINDLRLDVEHMKAKIYSDVQRGLILINEKANKNYSTEFIYRLFGEEGKCVFDTSVNVIGHLQQGSRPSPLDRNLGIIMGCKASEWFILQSNLKETNPKNVCLLGMNKTEYTFIPVSELENKTDFVHRLPVVQWWLNLRSLMQIMAKHGCVCIS